MNGELVDINPGVASVAPVWSTVLDAIWAWCGRGAADEASVLTSSVSGRQKHFRRLDARRIAAVTAGIADGDLDTIVVHLAAPSTGLEGGFLLSFAMTLASRAIRRERGSDAIYRRRNMTVTLQRSSGRYDGSDFDLLSTLVLAFARYIRPASGFASLLDEAPSAVQPLSPHVAPDRYGELHRNQDQIFGYDWVQLITPTVMSKLVLHGRHLDDLPAEAKVAVSIVDGTEAVLAALRRSPNDVTDADMRAFREFVLPVLFVAGPPMPGSPAAMNPDRSRPHGVLPEDWNPDERASDFRVG